MKPLFGWDQPFFGSCCSKKGQLSGVWGTQAAESSLKLVVTAFQHNKTLIKVQQKHQTNVLRAGREQAPCTAPARKLAIQKHIVLALLCPSVQSARVLP